MLEHAWMYQAMWYRTLQSPPGHPWMIKSLSLPFLQVGWKYTTAVFWRYLERILMERIGMKNRLDSKLQIYCIYYIRKQDILENRNCFIPTNLYLTQLTDSTLGPSYDIFLVRPYPKSRIWQLYLPSILSVWGKQLRLLTLGNPEKDNVSWIFTKTTINMKFFG